MKPYHHHVAARARDVLSHARDPVPWPQMVICAAATTAPVALGLARDEVGFAIYGALAGYLITLNDHSGALRHRALVTLVSFASLASAFALGLLLRPHPAIFVGTVAILTYWLGLMGGTGAEAERLLLFSVMAVVIVYQSPQIASAPGAGVFAYGCLALGVILVGQYLSDRMAAQFRSERFARLTTSLRGSLTREPARHRFALNYVCATACAIAVVERFQIERGYWMIITVLLVMRPSLKDGVYRQVQRLFGTLVGVAVGDLLILLVDRRSLLVLGVAACAFLVPYGLKRNYWLASLFATVLVVLFLTLPTNGPRDAHVPFVRLLATTYGCALSGMVTLLSAGVARWRRDGPREPTAHGS